MFRQIDNNINNLANTPKTLIQSLRNPINKFIHGFANKKSVAKLK